MRSLQKSRLLRRSFRVLGGAFVLANALAAAHAWRFTHFTNKPRSLAATATHPSALQSLSLLLTGVPNARPVNNGVPPLPYRRVTVQSNVLLDCWYLPAPAAAKGTVLLLHGYGGEKSGMLPKALVFHELGYNVLLPDLMGAGKSGGNHCTIGFQEAENVRACYDYLKNLGERNIILQGTSMGAAALMKYLHDGGEQPAGVIIECPYGTMYETVCARFRMVGAPTFPMAALLVFWGGVENGFWGFSHNPEDYASAIHCPTLLIYGGKDDRVSRQETMAIFNHLAGERRLAIYPEAGHNDYFIRYKKEWMKDVTSFIHDLENKK